MNIYNQFHGKVPISKIGRELRRIVNFERRNFKIITGYGSKTGKSKSREAALKSLAKMQREGLIKGVLPGGSIKYSLVDKTAPYYEVFLECISEIKKNKDFGNYGVVFVIVKKITNLIFKMKVILKTIIWCFFFNRETRH